MARRNRLTWASAPPATPNEGHDHPAAYEDPDMHAYENGDTSSWAEDPTSGPYPNSPEPAIPNEGHDHPATKRAARAEWRRRQAEYRKAGQAIRIAQYILGKNASEMDVENQAVALMDLSDQQINTALNRLASAFLAQDEMEMAQEDQNDPEAFYAGYQTYAQDDGEDDVEAMIRAMEQEMAQEDEVQGGFHMPLVGQDDLGPEEEAMLAQMMQEEAQEDEELGQEEMDMLAEMLKQAAEDEDEEEEEDDEEEEEEEEDEDEEVEASKKASDDLEIGGGLDLMEAVELSAEDRAVMAKLFPENTVEVTKEAARRPSERQPSEGVQSVGNLNKAASDEIENLSRLWKTDPDVSDVFKS